VHPLLRLAAAPTLDFILPLLSLGPTRHVGAFGLKLLESTRTDLGRDAPHLARVFDALPDATARRAFVRTIRAVVDWRGQAITMLDRCYLTRGMPTLLVWGTRDAVLPFRHAHLARAAMPGSKLVAFEGAGHFPHQSDPDKFMSVLRDFLSTTQAASYRSEEWRELLRQGRPARSLGQAAAAQIEKETVNLSSGA
jgi:pimeloyl-ACP methyl ester carboxylesterase